jgi:glycosyltransferase involved in cell wall biosynthesis
MKEISKVSVVMCTYNGDKYLTEQIESILNQTYPVYELIVQDDGSTDNTVRILRDYAEKYPSMRVYQNEQRKGVYDNFFSAMRRATGDYIAISDQDDIWKPDKIEQQMAYAKDFLLVVGLSEHFTTDQNIRVHTDKRVPSTSLERIIFSGGLPGHNLLLSKTFLNKIPNLTYWSNYFTYDHLIALTAASYQSIHYIPCVLVSHRRHISASSYTKPLNFEKTLSNFVRVLFRTFRQYWRIREPMSAYFANIYSLLESIPVQNESKSNAMKMAKYQQSGSFVDFLRLVVLCVRLRDKIFYAPEHNRLLAILRAIYFPISSGDYFRYMLK